MRCTARSLLGAALLALLPAFAAAQYTIKETNNAPPEGVKEAVRKQLDGRSIQLLDGKNNLLCEVWLCKEIAGKATPQQVKNGLTYRELVETGLVGVIKIADPLNDYRKQKIKAGIYTLRLGYQPMDGDHMGTAPHPEFLIAVPADADKGEAKMAPKELQDISTKASGTAHPAVFLLFPEKAAAEAKLVNKGEGHWVLVVKVNVAVDKLKAPLTIGLTLIGVSPSA